MLFANVVWPAIILEGRLLTWWAIAAGLVAEFVVLKFWLGIPTGKAAIADLLMNAVSTAGGLFLIPIAGLTYEFFPGQLINSMIDRGTFNPVAWIATCIIAASINAALEGLVLRLGFGVRLQRHVFFALFIANFVSVGLAFGSLFIWSDSPH